MELTNFEQVTVEDGRKAVRVCNWGSEPFTRVERKNGTFAWVPNGFKCITREAGVQLVGETCVDKPHGTALYRFSERDWVEGPPRVGEWRPNPTAALDSIQALLRNTKHRVGANGNVVIGVTYDNLQRRIIDLHGLDTTGTTIAQPQTQPPKSKPAARASRSRTGSKRKTKKRSISQAAARPSVAKVDEKPTNAVDSIQQKMDVEEEEEEGYTFSLFSDLEEEDHRNNSSKRMRASNVDEKDNEDDLASLPEFDFPVDQSLAPSVFVVTTKDQDEGLSVEELEFIDSLSDDDEIVNALGGDITLTLVTGTMLDQVEDFKPEDDTKCDQAAAAEEEFFPEEKKKECSESELLENTCAYDWEEEDEDFFIAPAYTLWNGST